MALATRPRLILMDEPSAGLSPKAAQEVLELARELTESRVTIVLVEQNVNQALRLSVWYRHEENRGVTKSLREDHQG